MLWLLHRGARHEPDTLQTVRGDDLSENVGLYGREREDPREVLNTRPVWSSIFGKEPFGAERQSVGAL